MAGRRMKRKQYHGDDDEEEEERDAVVESPTHSAGTRRRRRGSSQKMSNHDGEEEDDDDDGGGYGDDGQYRSGKSLGFTQEDPEPSQGVMLARPVEQRNLNNMDEEAREKHLTSLSRLILFRALEREPIDRLKAVKDAGINVKDKISSAAFQEAADRLRNVFGFELCRIPKYMEKSKDLAAKYRDRLYVLNQVRDTKKGTHSRAIQSAHYGSSIEKGFILLVCSLIYCKGFSRTNHSQKILERDLYRLLHRVDDSIPEEPPVQGTSRHKDRSKHKTLTENEGLTPNVDTLLEMCCHWDYLVKEKASDENCGSTQTIEDGDMLYSMGPRAVMEIGRRQIIFFCAEVLGEEPDPTMLREVAEDLDEEDAEDIYMEGPELAE
jgi:hypothetical protein